MMPAKSSEAARDNARRYKHAMIASGFTRVSVWVHSEDRDKLREHAEELRQKGNQMNIDTIKHDTERAITVPRQLRQFAPFAPFYLIQFYRGRPMITVRLQNGHKIGPLPSASAASKATRGYLTGIDSAAGEDRREAQTELGGFRLIAWLFAPEAARYGLPRLEQPIARMVASRIRNTVDRLQPGAVY